jgi:hypothetical protein
MPTGNWIKEKLIEAGDRGVCPADLFRDRRANYSELGLREPTGIMHSFEVFFAVLIRLHWVEKTSEEEVAFRKGTTDELNPSIPRKYYRITKEGLAQQEIAWSYPMKTLMLLHPERYPKAINGKYLRVRKPPLTIT